MRDDLKLFVFEGFAPDYTDGLAFAIAHSEEEARELIVKEYGYEPYGWGELKVYPLDAPIAKAVAGGG